MAPLPASSGAGSWQLSAVRDRFGAAPTVHAGLRASACSLSTGKETRAFSGR